MAKRAHLRHKPALVLLVATMVLIGCIAPSAVNQTDAGVVFAVNQMNQMAVVAAARKGSTNTPRHVKCQKKHKKKSIYGPESIQESKTAFNEWARATKGAERNCMPNWHKIKKASQMAAKVMKKKKESGEDFQNKLSKSPQDDNGLELEMSHKLGINLMADLLIYGRNEKAKNFDPLKEGSQCLKAVKEEWCAASGPMKDPSNFIITRASQQRNAGDTAGGEGKPLNYRDGEVKLERMLEGLLQLEVDPPPGEVSGETEAMHCVCYYAFTEEGNALSKMAKSKTITKAHNKGGCGWDPQKVLKKIREWCDEDTTYNLQPDPKAAYDKNNYAELNRLGCQHIYPTKGVAETRGLYNLKNSIAFIDERR